MDYFPSSYKSANCQMFTCWTLLISYFWRSLEYVNLPKHCLTMHLRCAWACKSEACLYGFSTVQNNHSVSNAAQITKANERTNKLVITDPILTWLQNGCTLASQDSFECHSVLKYQPLTLRKKIKLLRNVICTFLWQQIKL